MVTVVLIIALALSSFPVWASQAQQMCLSCHPVHYVEQARCIDCHRGNPSSQRKNIAHAGLIPGKYAQFTLGNVQPLRNGNRLIDQLACRRCHVTGGRGNRLATSLDLASSGKTPDKLSNSIRRPVDNMPNFGLGEVQTTDLVNAILAGARGNSQINEPPIAVHFTVSKKRNVDSFTRKCGSCHHLLSERWGALGTGVIGPDLSGLLSDYYPKTFRDSNRWTSDNLLAWLKNPRNIKQWAKMHPVMVNEDEIKELLSIIEVTAEPK